MTETKKKREPKVRQTLKIKGLIIEAEGSPELIRELLEHGFAAALSKSTLTKHPENKKDSL